ncbi:MAG TPA: 50S ribosomal protein L6 [Candidatus Krumholzibacteria bacterium]|nr:50S ribosomal protein L6 [Candidatus Krumholzibacteria bacterium]
MSRIGKQPVGIPSGVTVNVEAAKVTVKGPKGSLFLAVPASCKVALEANELIVTRANDLKPVRAAHGTTRAHLANMVKGVSTGFTRDLEIVGVGYKAEAKGKVVTLTIGYSHPIDFPVPEGITVETPEPTKIRVSGIDRQRVGQVASEIRALRAPEPYKGKGIKYSDETIVRKAGKSAASGA